MRSSIKSVKKLYNELATETGIPVEKIGEYINKAADFYSKRLNSNVTISPYRGNRWTLSFFVPHENACEWFCYNCESFEDWTDSPSELVARIKDILSA